MNLNPTINDVVRAWRAELERLGAAEVVARLDNRAVGSGPGAVVHFISASKAEDPGRGTYFPQRAFVEDWLDTERAVVARRAKFALMLAAMTGTLVLAISPWLFAGIARAVFELV